MINQLDQFHDKKYEKTPENIAASFQRTAIHILMKRINKALIDTGLTRLAAGGGVAANSLLRKELKALHNIEVSFPSMNLCTDNGAMIAGLAYQYLKEGIHDDMSLNASARVSAFKRSYP